MIETKIRLQKHENRSASRSKTVKSRLWFECLQVFRLKAIDPVHAWQSKTEQKI